ncbi:hypothetical protein O4H66_15375 [Comamonadaceae bacterium G21597-S1]|nr:hypothetical protein [Comamonadaceae bacterium G21597-S1]
MNRKIQIAAAVIGGVAGAMAAGDQTAAVQAIWFGIGCVAGAAIGGAIGHVYGRVVGREQAQRSRNTKQPFDQENPSDGLARSQRQLNDNYWIEHGRLTGNPGLPSADDSDSQV